MACLVIGIMVLTVVASCVSVSSLSLSQDSVTIHGVVVSSNGNPLRNAKVTATHRATGAGQFVYTDANGEYMISGLSLGFYDIEATKFLYKSDTETNEDLTEPGSCEYNFVLECQIPGSFAQPRLSRSSLLRSR